MQQRSSFRTHLQLSAFSPLLLVGVLLLFFTNPSPVRAQGTDPYYYWFVYCSAPASLCTGPAFPAVDPSYRNVYVSYPTYSRVVKFSVAETIIANLTALAIIGQPNPSAAYPNQNLGSPTARTMHTPMGIFIDSRSTLWLADSQNHRVLAYRLINATTSSNRLADLVLGQINFLTRVAGAGAMGMNTPSGVSIDANDNLWVADTGNNRILRFASSQTLINGAPADNVIGQPDFASVGSGTGLQSLNSPFSAMALPTGRLFVADTGNDRVVAFDTPLVSNSAASYSIGSGSGSINPTSLSSPYSLAIGSGNFLLVSSREENRTLVYKEGQVISSNNIPASKAFGPADLYGGVTSVSGATGVGKMWGIWYDAPWNTLFMAYFFKDINYLVVALWNDALIESSLVGEAQAYFPNLGPPVYLFPKDLLGRLRPGEYQLLFTPTKIEEKDSNDAVVTTMDLPQTGYALTIDKSQPNVELYTYVLQNPINLTVTYGLYLQDTVVTSAGLSFLQQPGDLKMTLSFGSWPFQSATNTLSVHIDLSFIPNVTSVVTNNFTVTTNATSVIFSAPGMVIELEMLPACEADGANLPITFSTLGSSKLIVNLPHYTNTLVYDPSFSVLVDTGIGDGGGGDGSGDGGSGGELLPLIALVALVIPVIAIIIFAGIVVYIYIHRRSARARAQTNLTRVSEAMSSIENEIVTERD